MNNYSNPTPTLCTNSRAKTDVISANHYHSLHAQHYATMDVCSQAHMSETADNIFNRTDKLKAFAKK